MRHCMSFADEFLHCTLDGAEGRSPAEYQHLTFSISTVYLLVRDVVGNQIHFCLTCFHHVLMVIRIITYITGDVLFFKSANSVFQPFGTWNSPGSDEFFITLVRLEFCFSFCQSLFEMHFNCRKVCFLWEPPGFCTIRNVAIAEEHYRCHVLQ